jgi:predicted amino acid racemase
VIDLEKIEHNARTLVNRLARHAIRVTGVTKATLGAPAIGRALLRAGVSGLGDSRIENLEGLRRAGVAASMTLLRSPMVSQVQRVVRHADVSFNTELDVISGLSSAATAQGRSHGVVLMVEMGDLREGIMPADLMRVVRETLRFPNINFKGIGTNLACRSGVVPDENNMAELSALADSIDTTLDSRIEIVSGGNSGNLAWALRGSDTARINDLRLGESILLGCETLHRHPIDGLHGDAITLVAEVIESKLKPSLPWGALAQGAFGEAPTAVNRGVVPQVILALGRQDSDPRGLRPPPGMEILSASSDHLIVSAGDTLVPVGTELTFGLNYSALVRAMTSPFVEKVTRCQDAYLPLAIARPWKS